MTPEAKLIKDRIAIEKITGEHKEQFEEIGKLARVSLSEVSEFVIVYSVSGQMTIKQSADMVINLLKNDLPWREIKKGILE